MKSNVKLKTYSIIFFLLTTFSAFADDNPEEVPEDLDGPTAPIGDHIWIIALIGIVYIFSKYKLKAQRQIDKIQKNKC
jgi:hypothetical protein